MALAKGFLLGVAFCAAAAILYAGYVTHPVRCLWCNQPAEYKTCFELCYGHTDIVHLQAPDGRLCMHELGEAISRINAYPYRDGGDTSINDFKRTSDNGAEHKSEERTGGPQKPDHGSGKGLDD